MLIEIKYDNRNAQIIPVSYLRGNYIFENKYRYCMFLLENRHFTKVLLLAGGLVHCQGLPCSL